MNNTRRRIFFVALICLVLFSFTALAAPRIPEKGDILSDYADVLSTPTLQEIAAFNERLSEKTGVHLHILSVHFLDGVDISTYANMVFERWGLSENDILLIMAVGEDSYTTKAGINVEKRFPGASQQNLLSATFDGPYRGYRYDEAVAAYVPALGSALAKQYGVTLNTTGLFGKAEQSSPTPTFSPDDSTKADGGFLWMGSTSLDAITQGVEQAGRKVTSLFDRLTRNLSFGRILFLLFLFSIIFGGRRKYWRGCSGCGCGPLGWIIAALGLGNLFNRK